MNKKIIYIIIKVGMGLEGRVRSRRKRGILYQGDLMGGVGQVGPEGVRPGQHHARVAAVDTHQMRELQKKMNTFEGLFSGDIFEKVGEECENNKKSGACSNVDNQLFSQFQDDLYELQQSYSAVKKQLDELVDKFGKR